MANTQHKVQVAVVLLAASVVTGTPARAYNGNLVACIPTSSNPSLRIRSGIDCVDTRSTFQLTARMSTGNAFDGCVPELAAPWSPWSQVNFGSGITAADVATIASVEFVLKGTRYDDCNLGTTTSVIGYGVVGSFKFFKADGSVVPRGRGRFNGVVYGALDTQTVTVRGMASRGFGVGAAVDIRMTLDVGHPGNADLLACSLGALCPPPLSSLIGQIHVTADGTSRFRLDYPDNSLCLGAGEPTFCCTGPGTGTC